MEHRAEAVTCYMLPAMKVIRATIGDGKFEEEKIYQVRYLY